MIPRQADFPAKNSAQFIMLIAGLLATVASAACGLPGPKSAADPSATPSGQISIALEPLESIVTPSASPSPTPTLADGRSPSPSASPSPTPTPADGRSPSPSPTPFARNAAAGRIAEVIDAPAEAYAHLLDPLIDLWLLDAELGSAIARQSWVTDDEQAGDAERSRFDNRRILEELNVIAAKDIELARLAVRLPWFSDSLTYDELAFLGHLAELATRDQESARLITSFPWFTDGSFDGMDASYGLRSLNELATRDVELSRRIVELWLAEGFPPWRTLRYVASFAWKDIEVARRLAEVSWLVDGVTEDELRALVILMDLGDLHIDLARETSGHPWFADSATASPFLLDFLSLFIDRVNPDELSWRMDLLSFTDTLDAAMVAEQFAETYYDAPGSRDRLVGSLVGPWLRNAEYIEGSRRRDFGFLGDLSGIASVDTDLALQIAALDWYRDGVSHLEPNALQQLGDIASKDIEIARRLAGFPWFEQGVTTEASRAIGAFSELASRHIEIATRLVDLPWLASETIGYESSAVHYLRILADSNVELTREAIGHPWFADRATVSLFMLSFLQSLAVFGTDFLEETAAQLSFEEILDGQLEREGATERIAEAIGGSPEDFIGFASWLADLWLLDPDLGTMAARLPWATSNDAGSRDGERNIPRDRSALEYLHRIGSEDIDLARHLVGLPWLVDGVSYFEAKFALPELADLATKDAELAMRIASFSWYADHSLETWSEAVGATVEAINDVAALDIELARRITRYPWYADDITYEEWVALLYLSRLAASDIELARKIAGLSWFAEDITPERSQAIRFLNDVAAFDIELARRMSEDSSFVNSGTLSSYDIQSLTDPEIQGRGQDGEGE